MRRVLEEILSAAHDPSRWPVVLDAITDEYGLLCATLFAYGVTDSQRNDIYFSAFLRRPEQAEAIRRFSEGSDDEAQLYERAFAMEAQRVLSETEVFGVASRADLPPSPYRDGLRSLGIAARSGAVLNKNGPWMNLFGQQYGSIDAHDRFLRHADNDLILPVFARSIELGRAFSALKERYRAALAALDKVHLGVVLVGPRRQVMLANAEAQRILDANDGAAISAAGELVAADPALGEAIDFCLGVAALSAPTVAARSDLLVLKRRSEKRALIVSAAPFIDREGELEPRLGGAFVLIVDPDSPHPIDTAGLAALGVLTEAEGEILAALAGGSKIDEIAEARDTTPNTVRAQVRSLSSKLRCHSQSEIVRLAAVSRLPLAE